MKQSGVKRSWILASLVVALLIVSSFGIWFFMRPQAAIDAGDCGANSVTVYIDPSFNSAGGSLCLTPGDYNTQYLMTKGFYHNISSIKLGQAAKATIYINDLGTTKQSQRVITASLKNLNVIALTAQDYAAEGYSRTSTTWSDNIAAIKVEQTAPCEAAVYGDYAYAGFGVCLSAGTFSVSNLDIEGVYSFGIKSLKLATGKQVTLLNPTFNASLILAEDTPDLRAYAINSYLKWDGRVDQIKVEAASNTPCTADINKDTFVNVADQTLLFSAWTDAR